MEPLSGAASVIAVIQLTAAIAQICGNYIRKVDEARQDIIHLQEEVDALSRVLKSLNNLLQSTDRMKLGTSDDLIDNLAKCSSTLTILMGKIDPQKTQRRMRKWGLRAFKWPLSHEEVIKAINEIERKLADIMNQKIDLSRLRVAKGAAFNDYENQHIECLQGTRVDVLRDIDNWSRMSNGECIFWLNGMAGTGKSTISRTVAGLLKRQNRLAASFFFKRGEEDRGNAKVLFSTLAKQLGNTIPELSLKIQHAIEIDPDISERVLREQFEKLILQPLFTLKYGTNTPMVIVIDALDECDRGDDIQFILHLLPRIQESSSLQVRIFLTSRPVLPIHLGFERIPNHYQDLVLHEIPDQVIEHDISLYIKDRISKLRQEQSFPIDWPGENSIKILIEKSVPLFISAATLCRFVSDANWDPQKRLDAILADQAVYASKMDNTYMPVLNQLLIGQDKWELRQLIGEFQDIIGVVILLFTPLSVSALSRLLEIEEDDINNRLRPFHSVLRIPGDSEIPVRLYHLSFRDFLLNPQTKDSSLFWIDERKVHRRLIARCINIMHQRLKKNICNLDGDGAQRSEVNGNCINHRLPPELQYSCRYWVQHLIRSGEPATGMLIVIPFLKTHFLHWVEAMSLLGVISEALAMMRTLQSVAHDFETVHFIYVADISPLQLYSSCLIFAPERSEVRALYRAELPNSIKTLIKVEKLWGLELQTLEGHSGAVGAVAFSPSNQMLATGSHDRTIKLWDTTTGSLQQSLEGHLALVRTIVFSPCGRLLASGSHDNTVKLWDAVTGAPLRTFCDHSGSVCSVDFSPSGQFIVSGSVDCTVKLWDTTTGSLRHTFKGHTYPVQAVAFSPDGQVLASGSHDKTIKLWDTTSGLLRQTLEDHSDWVRAVAFSSCGQVLASGSHDSTLKLWDTSNGTLKQTLTVEGSLPKTLDGHQGSVGAVAFSPDGRLLASGTHDGTIRLWDTATGALQQTLEGHAFSVSAVAFSPDSQLLASGSFDSTAKLWDTCSETLQGNSIKSSVQAKDRHSGSVGVVEFSPDGKMLASGSIDKTVKLWNAVTGTLQQTLEGHLDFIWTVKFSPDGRLLLSGSNDGTAKLWNTSSGTLQHTLTGHSGAVTAVAFSPNCQLLASCSIDNTIKIWNSVDGALKQSLSVDGIVNDIEFSNQGTVRETDFGKLSIQFSPNNPSLTPPELLIEDNWLSLHGRKVLWLPPLCRPSCSSAKERTIALGHTSGNISLIEVCT
ncbi:WD40-repeat-containing domain protein [Aspergillus ambiguus]|uniref:WD40-repeat-containing domain protein n=1 Tax=Aspergillus ambiguus TaxID=176160 RepID=UPI003CCE3BEC